MSYKRVLLLYPQYKNTHFGANHPPVGLGYLSEVLLSNGIEHRVIDLRLGSNSRNLLEKIRAYGPDLIGVSMMTLLHKETYSLMNDIKRDFPEIKIVAGGPHISTYRNKAMQDCRSIDFAVVQEGEGTLLELCQGIEAEKIKGLLYRKNDSIIFNGERHYDMALDKIPFPKYSKFEIDNYVTGEIPLFTSRGCPYKCIFCPVQTAIGRKFRFRSAANIVEEILFWYKKGKRSFGILDDHFLMIRERIMEFCELLEKAGLKDIELRCPNGVRADRVDKELLTYLKKVGFKTLAIGVEAGNNRILERIKKGETIETIKKAIGLACDLGFDVILFFIVGSPGETWADVEDSVRLARSFPVFDAKFYNLIPFPNTELFDWITANNYFIRYPEEYLNDASHWDATPVFATPGFSYEDRVKALKYTAKVRKEIRRNSLERKLKKLGRPISRFLANIFVLDFIQDQLMHNRVLRKFSVGVFKKIVKKQ